jgi:hypothetical protein
VDLDGVQVASDDSSVPDVDLAVDVDLAHDAGVRGDIRDLVQSRHQVEEGQHSPVDGVGFGSAHEGGVSCGTRLHGASREFLESASLPEYP